MKRLILLLAVLLVAFSPGMVEAKKSPYESGFDHGCDDAQISDKDERYINQPGKGPDFHTEKFMKGYHAGFHACYNEGEDEDGEFIPSSTQTQALRQSCAVIVIFGDVVCENAAGQGQQ